MGDSTNTILAHFDRMIYFRENSIKAWSGIINSNVTYVFVARISASYTRGVRIPCFTIFFIINSVEFLQNFIRKRSCRNFTRKLFALKCISPQPASRRSPCKLHSIRGIQWRRARVRPRCRWCTWCSEHLCCLKQFLPGNCRRRLYPKFRELTESYRTTKII